MTITTSAAAGDPLLAPKAAALVLGLSVSWLAKARLYLATHTATLLWLRLVYEWFESSSSSPRGLLSRPSTGQNPRVGNGT
jgi:hypothetical protein